MKFSKICSLVTAAFLLAAAIPASASVESDYFNAPRCIDLTVPTLLNASAATVTNSPIDISGFIGTVNLDIFSLTNAGGALTATIESSQDTTNWTGLSNYAVMNSSRTAFVITNMIYGGTNLLATNSYALPGTQTTPTAWTAGFNTPYLSTSLPFTNTGAITVTAKGWYSVGWRAIDSSRYIHIIWTPTGTSSNDIVGAEFSGLRGSGSPP